jgi:hypothetical protein
LVFRFRNSYCLTQRRSSFGNDQNTKSHNDPSGALCF